MANRPSFNADFPERHFRFAAVQLERVSVIVGQSRVVAIKWPKPRIHKIFLVRHRVDMSIPCAMQ